MSFFLYRRNKFLCKWHLLLGGGGGMADGVFFLNPLTCPSPFVLWTWMISEMMWLVEESSSVTFLSKWTRKQVTSHFHFICFLSSYCCHRWATEALWGLFSLFSCGMCQAFSGEFVRQLPRVSLCVCACLHLCDSSVGMDLERSLQWLMRSHCPALCEGRMRLFRSLT